MTRIYLTYLLFAFSKLSCSADQIVQNGIITHCGGPVHLESYDCYNCNFGQKATLSGVASGCDQVSGGQINARFTGYSVGQSEELFVIDNVQCGSTMSREWDVPEMTAFIASVAMGTVEVVFESDGEQVGCSNIPVAGAAVAATKTAALTAAGLGTAMLGGYYIYKFFVMKNSGAEFDTATRFDRMEEA